MTNFLPCALGQPAWAVEDRQDAIRVAMHPDLRLHVVAAVPIVQIAAEKGDEGGTLLPRRHGNFGIEHRQIEPGQLPVGRFHVDDARQGQFLGQTRLVGGKARSERPRASSNQIACYKSG